MFRCLVVLTLTLVVSADAFELRPLPVVCRPVEGASRTWDTRRFRIVSEIDVSRSDLERLAAVADATARAVAKHPVPWFDPPPDHRPELRIFGNARNYERAGATPGTAGTYLYREEAVVLNAEHLFPESQGPTRLKPLPDEEILVHEIVHLCMHGSQGRLPQWFAEGVCEYFAAAHRGAGRFDFDDMDRGIRDHLRHRFGQAAKTIPALSVASITGLDRREWNRFMHGLPPEHRYRGYVTALLLVHYHLHGTARRNEIVEAFGQRPPAVPEAFSEVPASATRIEESLTRYWRSRALLVRFENPAKNSVNP